mgnify:FL=1|tara:strand:- start:6827 stop:7054 length:228 start_codon:yes stop_codon:yes gene_type:complete
MMDRSDKELFEATDARLDMAVQLWKQRNNPFSDEPEVSMEGVLLAMLGASIEEAQERFVRVYNFRCHELDERELK